MNAGDLVNIILDLLYPPKCVFCGALLDDNERDACIACRRKLPFAQGQQLNYRAKNIDGIFSPFYYEGVVRETLLRYKFGKRQAKSRALADFMSKCIDENGISCDIITWVPLSHRRKLRRGFDQAGMLAGFVAAERGIACKKLLKKIRNNPPQSTRRDAREREKNVRGVYVCTDAQLVRGMRILLIDDIITTGSTVNEAAGVLKRAGASQVTALSVARGRG